MHVHALFTYPCKSLRGVPQQEVSFNQWGIVGDHELMIVGEDNVFLTQRGTVECPGTPKMALVSLLPHGDIMRLENPGGGHIEFYRNERNGDPFPARIHGNTVQVQCVSRLADQWLSAELGMSARLVGRGPQYHRRIDPQYCPLEREVNFADGFPVLLTTLASLEALNARGDPVIPMSRFRPQVVISGSPAWDEDGWKRIRIGSCTFTLPKPCGRCIMINTDQLTGARPKGGPLATLTRFRKIIRDDQNVVLFGENLLHDQTAGTIRVGDQVEVLETRDQTERPKFLV